MRIGEGRTEARSSICAVTSESRICRGCSTRSFEAGCSTTGGFTGRRSICRCANWTDRWPAGPIGNTRSCADICEGRRIGSRVSRDAIRSCGRTGKWVCGVAPWRKPYERRRSSTVLREARGETPRAHSPRGGIPAPGRGRAVSPGIPGTAGEVRAGASSGQDEADRVRQVCTGQPATAGSRRTGELRISGVHAHVRDHQVRALYHLAADGEETLGGETAASQADASRAYARTGIAGGRVDRAGAERFLPIPVSYTHLRAHETRHDLVCRLLLEK